jgi:hypothetical protein
VRVAWADGILTFSLEESDVVRTADRCLVETAPLVLDSFLAQLVRDEPRPADARENDFDRVVSAIRAAWDEGCPVASDPERTATVALRRIASIRRRLRGAPGRDQRIEDLAEGLRDRLEENPQLTGPLMEDDRDLAARIVDAQVNHGHDPSSDAPDAVAP